MSVPMDHRLPTQNYMRFPFEIGHDGVMTSDRAQHVREQIQQVLLTIAGERVFRPEFGAGVRRLVFEPNDSTLAMVTEKRLRSSLAEALRGEVDPKTLRIEVTRFDDEPEKLVISIKYELSAIGRADEVIIGGNQPGA
jgi:phage baseplate assembly protein W